MIRAVIIVIFRLDSDIGSVAGFELEIEFVFDVETIMILEKMEGETQQRVICGNNQSDGFMAATKSKRRFVTAIGSLNVLAD